MGSIIVVLAHYKMNLKWGSETSAKQPCSYIKSSFNIKKKIIFFLWQNTGRNFSKELIKKKGKYFCR
jgi:hypothetical protein